MTPPPWRSPLQSSVAEGARPSSTNNRDARIVYPRQAGTGRHSQLRRGREPDVLALGRLRCPATTPSQRHRTALEPTHGSPGIRL